MKKFYLCMLSLIAAMGIGAAAQTVIHLDEIYTVPNYNLDVTLVTTEDGDLYGEGIDASVTVDGLSGEWQGYDDLGGQTYKWENLPAGEHHITTGDGWFMAGTGKIRFYLVTADQAPEVVSVEPPAGSKLSSKANYTGEVSINFNVTPDFTDAYLESPGGQRSGSLSYFQQGTLLNFKVKEALNEMYANGYLNGNGGDVITLCISGIASANGTLYNGDGILRIKYVAAGREIQLVDTNFEDGVNFYTYYPAGDPRGIFFMEFDEPVNTSNQYRPVLNIGAGDTMVDNGYYDEDVYGVIDPQNAAKVIFDFTGVNRLQKMALKGVGDGMDAAIKIMVYDRRGQLAAGDDSEGSAGTYNYSWVIREVEPIDADYAFTPESGASLADTGEIELWITPSRLIVDYDGFRFTYDDGSFEIVSADKCRRVDSDGETSLYVPVPEKARTEPVDVSIENLFAADGLNHPMTASYNKFVVLSAQMEWYGVMTPLMGERLPVLESDGYWSGDAAHGYINVATTLDSNPSFTLTKAEYWDTTTNTQILTDRDVVITRDANGSWWLTGPTYKFELDADHSYALRLEGEVSGASVGRYNVMFYASSDAFTYSNETFFVGVTPEDGSALFIENPQFVVTFDAPVTITDLYTYYMVDGNSTPFKFTNVECMHPEDAAENFGADYEWRFTIDPTTVTLDDTISAYVAAADVKGKVVQGNLYLKSRDARRFSFWFTDQAPSTDPAAPFVWPMADLGGATIIDNITVFCADGIAPSPLGMSLYTSLDGLAWTAENIAPEVIDDWTVGYPNLAFNLKEVAVKLCIEENGLMNATFNTPLFDGAVEFVWDLISEPTDADKTFTLNYSPAENAHLTELVDFTIWHDGGLNLGNTDNDVKFEYQLEDGDTWFELATYGNAYFNPLMVEYFNTWVVDENTMRCPDTLNLQGKVVRATVPAGFFRDNAGATNELLQVHYGSASSLISIIAADADGLYTVYNLQGMRVLRSTDADAIRSLQPGIYVINGRKCVIRK